MYLILEDSANISSRSQRRLAKANMKIQNTARDSKNNLNVYTNVKKSQGISKHKLNSVKEEAGMRYYLLSSIDYLEETLKNIDHVNNFTNELISKHNGKLHYEYLVGLKLSINKRQDEQTKSDINQSNSNLKVSFIYLNISR